MYGSDDGVNWDDLHDGPIFTVSQLTQPMESSELVLHRTRQGLGRAAIKRAQRIVRHGHRVCAVLVFTGFGSWYGSMGCPGLGLPLCGGP